MPSFPLGKHMEKVHQEIEHLIDTALKEDIRTGDITSEACISPTSTISGKLLLKQGGCIAGLPFLETIFHRLDPNIKITFYVPEGSEHHAGTILGKVEGPARGILSAERVALNLLQHASGIATITKIFIEEIEDYNCEVLDTRKTLPGLRYLEKYAVRVGGGTNHRYALDHRFIIKNNHLAFVAKESDTPILEAVRRARQYRPEIKVEVEVEDLQMVEEALHAKADIIMLDNMTPKMARQAVQLINHRAYVEASGNITLDTIRAYAATGVDGISVGRLTHSVEALDISLRF